jgi:hypothetical protein
MLSGVAIIAGWPTIWRWRSNGMIEAMQRRARK